MEFDFEKFKRVTGGNTSTTCALQFRSDSDRNSFLRYLEEHCIDYTEFAAAGAHQVYWNEKECRVWGDSFASKFVTLDDLLLTKYNFNFQNVFKFVESEEVDISGI